VFSFRYGVGLADALTPLAEQLTTWDDSGRFCCTDPLGVEWAVEQIASRYDLKASTVVFQAYRDGTAVTPWHDDRTMTGDSMLLSVGATRTFQIRNGERVLRFPAPHDSLIYMPASFHERFEHRIGPEAVSEPRYSFIFRTPTKGHP